MHRVDFSPLHKPNISTLSVRVPRGAFGSLRKVLSDAFINFYIANLI